MERIYVHHYEIFLFHFGISAILHFPLSDSAHQQWDLYCLHHPIWGRFLRNLQSDRVILIDYEHFVAHFYNRMDFIDS